MEPIKFLVLGLAAGGAYAILGLGIVIAHRASGVVNFAHGATALVGALFYYELQPSIGKEAAALAGVAASALVGIFIQLLVLRPMRHSSPLMRVVATLAVLAAIDQAVKLRLGTTAPFVEGLFPATPKDFGGGVIVGTDRLLTFAVTAVLALILWVFYSRTRFGLATTALAENERSVASLGWSPSKLALVNWAAAGALAGIAGVLLVPITGLAPDVLTFVIVPALAAALIGNFASFPLTFLGGLAIGALQAEATRYAPAQGWASAVPFLAIILLLVFSGRSLPLRGYMSDRLPRVGTGNIRLPFVVVGIVVVGLSLAVFSSEWSAAVTTAVIYGLLALSLVVIVGFCGQLSLAQFAVAGIGALIATRLAATQDLSFPVAFLIGAVATVPIGVFIALPAVRVRGVNLAVVTLGLAVVVTEAILSNPDYTGGIIEGTQVDPPSIFGIDIYSVLYPQRYAAFGLILLILLGVVVANLRRGRIGRRMIAVRTNERAAASMGIGVVAVKLYAFAVGAFIAAVGGIYMAYQNTHINFESFGALDSVSALLLTVLSAVGFVSGAFLAAGSAPRGPIEYGIANFTSTGNWYLLIMSILTLGVLILNPDGVIPQVMRDAGRLAARLGWKKKPRVLKLGAVPAASAADRVSPITLELDGLTVTYGGTTALKDVSLRIEPGSVVGLIGPNGAGKTTLIDAVSGMVAKYSGSVRLDGESIDKLSPAKRARAGVVRSFQGLELFEDLTVAENVAIGSVAYGATPYVTDLFWPQKPKLSPQAKMAIHEFGLEEVLGKLPTELSYAQRRLVAIARAVAVGGSVLLLDEPAAGLDTRSTAHLAQLVRKLASDYGMSVLLVEHDVDMVLATCDEVVVLNFGNQIASGSSEQVRRNEKVIEAYLGTPPSEDADAVATSPASEDDPRESVVQTPGAGSESETSRGPAVVQTKELSVGYGRIPVVSALDMTVRAGEVTLLLGANGAGKTTTMFGLAGELPPLDGVIEMFGQPNRRPLHQRARQGLGLVPEERSVTMGLSVRDNLRLGPGGVDGALEYGPELEPILDRKARMLSGGELQILTLSRVLAAKPKLLLADELSLGLAPLVVQRLLQALRQAADKGTAVLIVEQHVRSAMAVADQMYVMRRGRVVLEGRAADFRNRLEDIEAAYLEGEPGIVPNTAPVPAEQPTR